ncbi:MAG: hypothetical protein CMH23_10420 [Methylophaga sp.]|uniref:tail completion protein gp17 n=1 Tax=Methylophaga sp. TaxID=2024840 RepID=UPI000C8D95F3|nr:DUF3168 domain-containing protein [Methylophaga sp.]MBN46873.1 hypothetical protein [Methylophaga sp.]|tara:strand:+ start:145 stop:501 length:357 start_codon:yes stop_codon:yes gene_type:complete
MSVRTIVAALKAHSGLSALVSNRVYRSALPQNPVYPLVMFEAEEEFINTLAGKSSLNKWNFEFTCKSKSLETMESLTAQLTAALNSSTFSSVVGDVTDDEFEDELGVHTASMDVSIWL